MAWDEEDDTALQYISGSIGDPKGIMVSRGNLMANHRGHQTELRELTRLTSFLWKIGHERGDFLSSILGKATT